MNDRSPAASRTLAAGAAKAPEVKGFYDRRTGSIQYVVTDPGTRAAVIIDPVWDYDERAGRVCTKNADTILSYVEAQGLDVQWVLDTHPHADHFSAAHYLKQRLGARTGIGERVVQVQTIWKDIYNLGDFATDGSQWDHLFRDGELFRLGDVEGHIMLCPGHTLCSIAYVIGDAAFVNDTLMVPDSGTSRADFPGGDARELYRSIQKFFALPGATRIFVGHDYCKDGRDPQWESTVGVQRQTNVHVKDGTSEDDYIRVRQKRDAGLPLPQHILAALQVNLRAGRLPEPEANGVSYLKIPLNRLAGYSEVCDG